MIFWHTGGTLALARYLFRDPAMDVRLLLVGALLPDLVDKPLGRIFFNEQLDSGRVFAHTLAFSALVLGGILVATRRGTQARRRWVPLAIGCLLHLLLDFMWTQPETLLWPALGTDFHEAKSGTLAESLAENLTNPWVMSMEAAGLAYLVWLWRRTGLGDRERRRSLARTGQLPRPLERPADASGDVAR